jgi:hypothetical protein
MTVFATNYSKSPISPKIDKNAVVKYTREIGDFEYFAAKTVIPVISVINFLAGDCCSLNGVESNHYLELDESSPPPLKLELSRVGEVFRLRNSNRVEH